MALSKKDRQGIMLMAGVGVLLLAMMVISARLSDKPKLDQFGCASPVVRKTVLLIDRSDDTPAQTTREIISRAKRFVADQAQENELISLFEVSGVSRTHLDPVFSACVPPRDGNDLYENRSKIRRFFDEKFVKPLDEALSKSTTKSGTSPISEAIIDLSASNFLAAPTSRLLVFSDLLQNSENASLYGCTSATGAIAQFRDRRAGAIERPTFKNTAVELHVIPREGIGRTTVRCRDGFWAWFFGDNSGQQAGLNIHMLPGGAKMP